MSRDMSGAVSRAIWGIIYDLPAEGREEYLDWFHDVHVGEKLARPGYTWAAHYEVVSPSGEPATSQGTGAAGPGELGYIALFGGTDTGIFFNPSPAQIKPRQTELTRTMMARRIASRSFIAAEEWHVASSSEIGDAAPAIELVCCDVGAANDEDFGAWCVQDHKPHLAERPQFVRVTKLLTATGPAKHVVLSEFADLGATLENRQHDDISEWTSRVVGYLSPMPGSPLTARRIFPII